MKLDKVLYRLNDAKEIVSTYSAILESSTVMGNLYSQKDLKKINKALKEATKLIKENKELQLENQALRENLYNVSSQINDTINDLDEEFDEMDLPYN